MTVEYKFADGTVSEVEVSEEIGTYIMDSRRKESSDNRKERYHCCPLDVILYEGSEFGYEEGNYLEEREDTELLKEVLGCLTDTQRKRMLLFIEGWSFRNIAEQEGANHKSVEESIKAAQKKMQKHLQNTPTKWHDFLLIVKDANKRAFRKEKKSETQP